MPRRPQDRGSLLRKPMGGLGKGRGVTGVLPPALTTDLPQYWCHGLGCVHSVTNHAGDDARVLGSSSHARVLRSRIHAVAESGNPILITGETGTGKEVVARAIHCAAWAGSPAASLVALGCGTLPEDCLSKVLQARKGVADCRAAHLRAHELGGTLMLDEISELSPRGQDALMGFLDDEACNLDGARSMLIIATTNQNLHNRVVQGAFRSDLYRRLTACEVAVPPLRERVADIPLFLSHLIREANLSFGTEVSGIAPLALQHALAYPWPGNVRELKNVVLQAALLTRNGSLDELSLDAPDLAVRSTLRSVILHSLDLNDEHPAQNLMFNFEDELLRTLKVTYDGNKIRMCEALGVSLATLETILRRHGLLEASPD